MAITHPHGDKLNQLSRHVPVTTIIVDTPERIARSFDIVDEVTGRDGLVASEMVPALIEIDGAKRSGGTRLSQYRYRAALLLGEVDQELDGARRLDLDETGEIRWRDTAIRPGDRYRSTAITASPARLTSSLAVASRVTPARPAPPCGPG